MGKGSFTQIKKKFTLEILVRGYLMEKGKRF